MTMNQSTPMTIEETADLCAQVIPLAEQIDQAGAEVVSLYVVRYVLRPGA